ncbi:hypothetical protein LCGC14_0740210 [marine sediment metagenome]|uniref:Uncharacterized protein n=1 Tax=marine sediment metagenome TaxID=412755 RepID=A0A0F9QRW6_9ZZZZ
MSFQAQQGRRTRLADLVIDNGVSESNFLNSDQYSMFTHLAILAPATLTDTVRGEVNSDPSADQTSDTQWKAYHPITPGTLVAFPVSVVTVIPAPPTHGFRLNSDSNEGAKRTFKCWGLRIPRSAA